MFLIPFQMALISSNILRQKALTRIFSQATLGRVLDVDNPMASQFQRQLVLQPFDERRAVLVQERDETDFPLLRVAVGERDGLRVDKLTLQRLVTTLGGLNQTSMPYRAGRSFGFFVVGLTTTPARRRRALAGPTR